METNVLAVPLSRPSELTSQTIAGKHALTLEGAYYLIQLFQHGFLTRFDPELAAELDALPYLSLDRAATKQVFLHIQDEPTVYPEDCKQEAAEVLWHLIREFHEEALLQARSWLQGDAAEAKLNELFGRDLVTDGEHVLGYYSKAGGYTCFDTTTSALDCRIVWTCDESAAQRWLLGTINREALPQRQAPASSQKVA